MSKTLRVAVLATALLSALTMMASSAGAVTWHNTGDTAFTATGGAMTFSSTATTLNCAGSTSTATVTAAPVGAQWAAISFTTRYSGCSVSGNDWPWECNETFTATGQPAAGTTTGTLDTTCRTYIAGVQVCHAIGTQGVTYTNPVAPSTFGRFLTQTGGTIRLTNGAASCPLGNGELIHKSPELWTVQTATGGPSSPHLGPVITRTA